MTTEQLRAKDEEAKKVVSALYTAYSWIVDADIQMSKDNAAILLRAAQFIEQHARSNESAGEKLWDDEVSTRQSYLDDIHAELSALKAEVDFQRDQVMEKMALIAPLEEQIIELKARVRLTKSEKAALENARNISPGFLTLELVKVLDRITGGVK